MQKVPSNVCCLNNHKVLNLLFPNPQNGDRDGDKLTRQIGCQKLRETTPTISPTLMHKKTETFGNQSQALSWLWWPPLPGQQGRKWGQTDDKQRKRPTPWGGEGSGSSEKRRSQTLDLKNEK